MLHFRLKKKKSHFLFSRQMSLLKYNLVLTTLRISGSRWQHEPQRVGRTCHWGRDLVKQQLVSVEKLRLEIPSQLHGGSAACFKGNFRIFFHVRAVGGSYTDCITCRWLHRERCRVQSIVLLYLHLMFSLNLLVYRHVSSLTLGRAELLKSQKNTHLLISFLNI